MGKLTDGQWNQGTIISSDKKGAYDRPERTFRGSIKKGASDFPPESGRYHLYVSYACPWAHRTLIYRALKGLEPHISVTVVKPDMLDKGWELEDDPVNGCTYLYEVYQKADSKVSTSVTVPVLWDKQTGTIVNNESSEIIRMFNSEFDELTGNHRDFYPESLRGEIDRINEKVYHGINNGVYRAGFARNQQVYEEAVGSLFNALDEVDALLEGKEYLVGDTLTEADIRLMPTLLRFDIVYVTHFKCNLKRIADYKNLGPYRKRLYAMDEFTNTTHFDHIKRHYFYSHETINPYRIIPVGPETYL